MKEESAAHIFRKNPSDRATDTVGTPKDDYFLEDPYEGRRRPSPARTVSSMSAP